ncbi:MAG: SRPBCC domain-containing protein [Actinomycetota bacterium]|nr:SRPBCC domain-containing protein [Actinomycetota bacterium]
MELTATMRSLDDTAGTVRVEDVYDTDIDDLWRACTTPERLVGWLAQVSGDLRVGGTVRLLFTSTWAGPATIEVCDAPHHLLLTTEPGTDDETQIEAWLTSEGPRTRLVVEERGLPVARLHLHGAGWQVHLEDLGRSLAAGETAHHDGWSEQEAAPAWHRRWTELTPAYEECRVP